MSCRRKNFSNAVETCRMCGNRITRLVNYYYSLKLVLRDETGDIDETAWTAGRDFTGVSADEFTAIEVESRKEAIELLRRNLGLQWEVDLTIDNSKQGIYVRIDPSLLHHKKGIVLQFHWTKYTTRTEA
ncbi:hypothetical protein R1flu_002540 [Riccia fluitans]|uniref:Site-specific DNA endonuclease n=1 Tax=Riccia fluitans TaxID=41844 RepID=A0ABD1Y6E8_9MARC